jgi:hypothetical protein
MPRQSLLPLILLLSLLASACTTGALTPTDAPDIPVQSPEPPTVQATAAGLVISEVLSGEEGKNSHDFIELYNPLDEPLNLDGYALFHQLKDGSPEVLVYEWKSLVLVPPHGHYLLGYEGEEFGLPVDARFKQPLVPDKGGLALRWPDGILVESLVWGDGPSAFIEGSAAPVMAKGVSLERAPGGSAGSTQDMGENTADFILNPVPDPQNSGSPLTPFEEQRLIVTLTAPPRITPGAIFTYTLSVENHTDRELQDVSVRFPLPQELENYDLPPGVEEQSGTVVWHIDVLAQDEIRNLEIPAQAPWSYGILTAHSYHAQAETWSLPAFGAPLLTPIEGGSVPIGTARTLFDTQLTVEGIATMYTGGYYAGSGGKFYLADETGGIQVYLSGSAGGGELQVPLCARVRASGELTRYRGALELIPSSMDDIEVLGSPSADSCLLPDQASIQQAASDMQTLPGRLIQVQGTVARVEEFSYSYEMDILNDEGQLLTLYIDKETGINVETIESGQLYRISGIIEVRDTSQMLYPRQQSDLQRVFPPEVILEALAPAAVPPGERYKVALKITNHTPQTVENLIVQAVLPPSEMELVFVLDDGNAEGENLTWEIPELAGSGTSQIVRFEVLGTKSGGSTTFSSYSVSADGMAQPASGPPVQTFIGSSVPIWAIQGDGFRSPYRVMVVPTKGIVTGIFPDMGGFWIQELITDTDPLTSAGLFIDVGEIALDLEVGDEVQVSGLVREAFQQTQLFLSDPGDLLKLDSTGSMPQPIELDPPVNEEEAAAYFEALEGMLVQVSGPAAAVSPSNKYGEFSLVLPYHNMERLLHGEQNGMAITVDDGSSLTHSDQSTMPYIVTTGDSISDMSGPLAYTFDSYKIELLHPPQITTQSRLLPDLPPAQPGEFSLMTWNVENLFDFKDPHPDSPPIPGLQQYKTDLSKVANTILMAGLPTIVGLQEVENIGILEDLAEHELLVQAAYSAQLIEGTDSRGIDVGYLVRMDQVNMITTEQYDAPEGITSRPPLFIEVEIGSGEEAGTVYVFNNHFTSMSGGVEATRPRRVAQAAWNASLAADILGREPEALVAVIGDLNSYYESPPIETLREAGLAHIFDALPADQRYTYIYQGISQTLDHVLVSLPLFERLQWVDVLHTNADFPPPLAGDDSALHKSDHDPVIAVFKVKSE